MNTKQQIIIIIAGTLIFVTLLFPPFHILGKAGMIWNKGYSFILLPPHGSAIINVGTLLTQWVGILLLAGVTWLLASDKT